MENDQKMDRNNRMSITTETHLIKSFLTSS